MSLPGIIVIFVFLENFILAKFLGFCPFIGESGKIDSAVGMGFSMIFVMTIAALVTWLIYHGILIPLKLSFLKTIAFILAIVFLVRGLEQLIRKISPPLYKALGCYLPLVTANCAVFGVTLLTVAEREYSLTTSVISGFAGGLGFLVVIIIISFIREKMETEYIPGPFRGIPIIFITAGLMSLAFMAFDKALLQNLHLLE